MTTSESSERLLLTLWVGSLWAIGYLAVPMAFINLNDVQLAASFAGKLFFAVHVLGIGCAIVLLLSKVIQFQSAIFQNWRFLVLLLMLGLSLFFVGYLQPEVTAIRQLEWKTDSALVEQFDQLHSLSENVYLVLSLLGLALVLSKDKSKVDINNGAK